MENKEEVWVNRKKIINFEKESQANAFIERNQSEYNNRLQVDLHKKDGYVVFYY